MIDSISLYRFFCEAARCKSISAAAKNMYVTQPAVSNAIIQLESILEVKLFNRSGRGISLTPEGQVLFEHVSRALNIIEEGEDKLRDMRSLAGGVLRVGASDMTLKFFLLDYIEKFKKNFPLVRLTVSNAPTPSSLHALKNGDIDFAVISGPVAEDDGIVLKEVRQINDIIVASDKFDIGRCEAVDIETISDHPLIMLESGTSTRKYIDNFLPDDMKEPDIELATSDLILDFARRGFGVAFIVEDFAKKDLETGTLYEIKLKNPPLPRPFYLAYRSKQTLSAATMHFLELVSEDTAILQEKREV